MNINRDNRDRDKEDYHSGNNDPPMLPCVFTYISTRKIHGLSQSRIPDGENQNNDKNVQ